MGVAVFALLTLLARNNGRRLSISRFQKISTLFPFLRGWLNPLTGAKRVSAGYERGQWRIESENREGPLRYAWLG